ncbi:hypothetical protein [Paenibacillus mendelii]|uniref:Uncharacterized protein n=1 Tax=Paenibacillus mendelii TaxID=206163 RepID=A0ABV6J7W2_9BACL|nr:hypothetical protein [Paenibacillus mendelii]MCQ6561421.1 hypothetical protein [Paenibacillus mendelii]
MDKKALLEAVDPSYMLTVKQLVEMVEKIAQQPVIKQELSDLKSLIPSEILDFLKKEGIL